MIIQDPDAQDGYRPANTECPSLNEIATVMRSVLHEAHHDRVQAENAEFATLLNTFIFSFLGTLLLIAGICMIFPEDACTSPCSY